MKLLLYATFAMQAFVKGSNNSNDAVLNRQINCVIELWMRWSRSMANKYRLHISPSNMDFKSKRLSQHRSNILEGTRTVVVFNYLLASFSAPESGSLKLQQIKSHIAIVIVVIVVIVVVVAEKH
uniref:Uncharacterized protein n=1 Tax=Glossina austeni TaxID=7395 RepID=A0A1A9VQA8_GLOAU